MECVTSPTYTITINGNHEGYFKGMKGLRQGDSISPYLFALAMEVLSGQLNLLSRQREINWHPKCASTRLNHLAFVDDLFIFVRGDVQYVRSVRKALDYFHSLSGLLCGREKSRIFCGGCDEALRNLFCSELDFGEGTLPITYLGIPLIASNLKENHCSSLVQKIENKLSHWNNKMLSYSGRLLLIKAVLTGIHLTGPHLSFPMKVIQNLEKKLAHLSDA